MFVNTFTSLDRAQTSIKKVFALANRGQGSSIGRPPRNASKGRRTPLALGPSTRPDVTLGTEVSEAITIHKVRTETRNKSEEIHSIAGRRKKKEERMLAQALQAPDDC
ncbi:hypothetical protein NDU88_006370 [Pleurodeles waltl]|uniref:Uncharacterized protein n=1 Tax=Pleurodeles waltl TaxID=8319 RepID=A0AAV7UMK4_PLEWA|nr:hypothetical protein NDU88_006370 [Pleurodeles waltl]